MRIAAGVDCATYMVDATRSLLPGGVHEAQVVQGVVAIVALAAATLGWAVHTGPSARYATPDRAQRRGRRHRSPYDDAHGRRDRRSHASPGSTLRARFAGVAMAAISDPQGLVWLRLHRRQPGYRRAPVERIGSSFHFHKG